MLKERCEHEDAAEMSSNNVWETGRNELWNSAHRVNEALRTGIVLYFLDEVVITV